MLFLIVSPSTEIPPPLEFSETDTTDVPEFEDVVSEAHSPVSEWGNGEYTGPETPDGQNLPDFYSNGIPSPAAEVHAAPVFEEQHHPEPEPEPESSVPVAQETPLPAG